ncbi:MAG: twin-arginine translocase TatA/TatE family subunit [Paludibacteraceae bacterium]|nr:twin-arginine translocase TatA/TatE family subunit [Paludibacteraceae bacterium]
MLGTWEIILIALVILLIFGGRKIPELMKGIGKGVRSFKDGLNGNDDTKEDAKEEVKQEQKQEQK